MACNNPPEDPPDNTHHIIPQFNGPNTGDYQQFFKELGVDIHQWVTDIPEDMHHQDIHDGLGGGGYNATWAEWMGEHLHEATADDVYEFAAEMIERYDIPIRP